MLNLESDTKNHLRKPRVLSPLRSLRTLGRSAIQKSKLPLRLFIGCEQNPSRPIKLSIIKLYSRDRNQDGDVQ